ncbi:cytochrome c biogenesis protein CcsA [Pallidibacillus pasinlerensis]|uniref:Cytochrome c biogenesis protein CcsA n=1 Tax=Pallidibacillus pasinlerensis TaxID=2703818 RepID=A0ABX0A729_9BACI|nr:cytochrome c biogenesis protein CcsA [Pallidibacillus pasinlerensis]NCU16957.1 cytochrome c biogenesis protein CcsA [Pallidibacillus pasinlerensis]
MTENFLARMQEGMVLLYAFSLISFYIDFLLHNRKAKKIAFWLLYVVWLLQTILVIDFYIRTGRLPLLSLEQGLYFYSWLLITFTIFVTRIWKIEFIAFFTNLLGFIIVVIYTFAPFQWQETAVSGQLISELLFIHIFLSILAYVVFSLSCTFSLLYLIQYQLLKKKKWRKRLMRLNDLMMLEKFASILIVVGLPIFTIGIILGLQWAFLKIPTLQILDAKIIGSFLIIIIYSVIVYLKLRKDIAGKKLAYYNISAFLVVLINFFLFGNFSSFHF